MNVNKPFATVLLASGLLIGGLGAGALTVWLLVQEALGIFLRPLPWFLG